MLEQSQLEHTSRLSTNAYSKACAIVGYTNLDLMNKNFHQEISHDEMLVLAEELDEVYREILCKLPTYVLQNIITAAEENQQRRTQKTIDTIATELFERELQRSEKE